VGGFAVALIPIMQGGVSLIAVFGLINFSSVVGRQQRDYGFTWSKSDDGLCLCRAAEPGVPGFAGG
jgi:hypothetical protein